MNRHSAEKDATRTCCDGNGSVACDCGELLDPVESDATHCPTCGSDGVTACVGLDGADHPDRLPYFDERAIAVIDSTSRSTRILPPGGDQ